MSELSPKQEALALLKQEGPTVRRMTLVYLLLSAGVSFVVGLMVPDVFAYVLTALAIGDQKGAMAALNMGGGSAFFLSLLLVLYGWVLKMGYSLWALGLTRGQPGAWPLLLEGFGFSSRVVFLQLMKGVYLYLWTVGLGTLGALVFMVPLSLLGLDVLGMVVMSLFFLGLTFFLLLRYSLLPFALVDRPQEGTMGAISRGVKLLKGQYRPAFRMFCSFWPWISLYVLLSLGLSVVAQYPALQRLFQAEVIDQTLVGELLAYPISPVFSWLGTGLYWLFLWCFLPVYHVSLAVFYGRVGQEEGQSVPNPL